ncbi:hypothetical protein F4859DRAFT_34889 [Xylaria cf. heliscus]|nr:hypothetical protein F4859DRAFT_34889 [Xylaria cf. heliscus]
MVGNECCILAWRSLLYIWIWVSPVLGGLIIVNVTYTFLSKYELWTSKGWSLVSRHVTAVYSVPGTFFFAHTGTECVRITNQNELIRRSKIVNQASKSYHFQTETRCGNVCCGYAGYAEVYYVCAKYILDQQRAQVVIMLVVYLYVCVDVAR